jgi:hypothetical protein
MDATRSTIRCTRTRYQAARATDGLRQHALKFLKFGAQITISIRWVKIAFASPYPGRRLKSGRDLCKLGARSLACVRLRPDPSCEPDRWLVPRS